MIDPALLGEAFLLSITLTFMVVGLLGLIIPIFPGITIIWLSALFFAIVSALRGTMTGWDWFLFALITILMGIGNVIDNFIIAGKLRETGTPWRSIFLSSGMGLIASIFLTPFASLLVTPLTLLLVEYLRLRDWREAATSTRAFLIGFGWTLLALFAIGASMIGLWLLWALI